MIGNTEQEGMATLRSTLGSARVLELLQGRPEQRSAELLALYTELD